MAAIKFFIIINGSICEQHADNNCVFLVVIIRTYDRILVWLRKFSFS